MISDELLNIAEFYPYFSQVLTNKSSSGFISLLEPPHCHSSESESECTLTSPKQQVEIIPIHRRTQHLKLYYEYIVSALLTYFSIKAQQLHLPVISPLLFSPISSLLRFLTARSMDQQSLLISNIPGPGTAFFGSELIQAMLGLYIGQSLPFITIVTINHTAFITFTAMPNEKFLQSLYQPKQPINTPNKKKNNKTKNTEQNPSDYESQRAMDLVQTMLSPQYLLNQCFYDELFIFLQIYQVHCSTDLIAKFPCLR
jgi:hypothetical protein